MNAVRWSPHDDARKLRELVAECIAFEDEMAGVLADGAAALRRRGFEGEAREVEDQIRRHRVSLIKVRAQMRARGIEL